MVDITIASTPTHAIYQVNGPHELVHIGRSRCNRDPQTSALLSALDMVPWQRYMRMSFGAQYAGKKLPLTVHGVLADLNKFTDASENEALGRRLSRFEITWNPIPHDDIQGLQDWSNSISE